MNITKSRIIKHLKDLAKYGANASGGVTRGSFSKDDLAARNHLIGIMKKLNLQVRIDVAGNIIGRREGVIPDAPAIAIGSHIDTVANGGQFDGALGVISAIEVTQTLIEHSIILNHPLEIIIFTDEEGSMIGSKSMAGSFVTATLDDETVTKGIKFLGGNPDKLEESKRYPEELLCFIELHIEQGCYLEQNEINIGIVDGIVGIQEWKVEVTGVANHSGTTPMALRQDALLAASYFVTRVYKITHELKGKQVATVGRLEVESAAANVIPGKVHLSLEIRDISEQKIEQLFKQLNEEAGNIARNTDTRFHFTSTGSNASPALMNDTIKSAITNSAQKLGYSSCLMPSGAGHDAQNMSQLTPTGMIFVPSKNGISHSPHEYTNSHDCKRGANVLLHTILKLDD